MGSARELDIMARKVTPVLQYARQLLVLHALDLQGKNDSAEADAVRDEMDVRLKR